MYPTTPYDTLICTGEQVVLNGGANFDTYLWSNGSTNQTNIVGLGSYDLQVSLGICKFQTSDFNILNYPSNALDILGDSLICEGYSTFLRVSNPSFYRSFHWSNGSTVDSTKVFLSGPIYLTTIDNFNCPDSASFNMKFLTDNLCDIPNVITPNGDGNNDYFYTFFAASYDDVDLQIYNRWGKRVFKTNAYKNDWDGTDMSGKKLAEGTYYFITTFDEGLQNERGIITLFYSK